jgi:signal transduction histidine kinase
MDIAVKTLQRKENELTKENFDTTLSVIGRQNTRLQKLFAQVTEASLTPKDITSENKSTIGCKDIIEIVSDFKVSKPDVTINCSAEDTGIAFKIDRFYLNTILINLLDNAVKYGATTIDIKMENLGDKGIISIQDNGPGIPIKEQALVFDKFYRVEKGNIHNTKGLGLGLYYTRQVVEAYKGTITISSEETKGALFTITIPLS